jgi:Matrixin
VDDSGDLDPIPELDESFVLGAIHHEPSHRERQLEVQRRLAKRSGEHYRAERDSGLREDERKRVQRFPKAPPPPANPWPKRRRQILGVVIAAVVVVVAVDLPGLLSGRHSSSLGLVTTGNQDTSCPSSVYPAGAEYRFERCQAGQGLGWDRCSTLTVAINPANAPTTWREDTDNALGQLARATGLHFRSIGSGKADISLSWTAALLMAGGADSDKAGQTMVTFSSSAGGSRLTAADIEISNHLTGDAGLSAEIPVLLHELGHAVGLGHFSGREVMNPVDQGFANYQPGDSAGLAALYRPDTCN